MTHRNSGHDRRTMETSAGHLNVRGRLDDGKASFTLDGDVDLTSCQAVRDAVCEALDSGARAVELDLSGVTFLDSSGLNGLLNTARDVHRRGATLSCNAPHGGEPRVVIDLAGVAKLLNVPD
jgi:anti-anti-sigma factor